MAMSQHPNTSFFSLLGVNSSVLNFSNTITNQTEELSKAVGNLFAPAVLAGTKALTKLVEAVTAFAESPLGKTVAIFTAFALAVKGVVVVAGLATAALTLLIGKLTALGIASLGLKIYPPQYTHGNFSP